MNEIRKLEISRKFLWFLLVYFLIALFFLSRCNNGLKTEFPGSFYANDSGESHGGFEWAGDYTARLAIQGRKGTLTLTFSVGLGDPLSKHRFSISDFLEAAGIFSFKIEGQQALLEWVENDTIWNGDYSKHFTGNNSADSQEQVGHLPIGVFTGYASHYYVELRLRPAQQESRFNLMR